MIKEQEAVSFLRQLGYTIIEPEASTSKLSPAAVVEFYYSELFKILKDVHTPEMYSPNKDRDIKEIIKYQNKAVRLGLTKVDSLKTLVKAVKVFFKYFNELGIRKELITLGFLLSSKGSWIFSKATELHKSKIKEFEEGLEGKKYRDEIETTECDRFYQLINDRLEEITKVKELVHNGKEETKFRGTGIPKLI